MKFTFRYSRKFATIIHSFGVLYLQDLEVPSLPDLSVQSQSSIWIYLSENSV